MREKSKSTIVLLLSIALFLIALPLVSAEVAAEPKPEGTLVVALPTLAEEGFLADRCSSAASPLWFCVYDFLIHSDSTTLKPIPGVAERWEYSKDYRTLTFYLRKGIQFHDGWGELTAEDVKWTIEFYARPTSLWGRSKLFRKMISSIEVVDRYILVIHLKEPDPVFWLSFCTSAEPLPILCKKYIGTVGEEKVNRVPIGSGPYRLVEQKIGDYAKFEALEKHWLVVPEFKYMILRVVPEESTRIAMLKTGEVDIATDLSMGKVREIEKAGHRIIVKKNGVTHFLPFGGMFLAEDKRYVEGYHRKDPWVDIRVREAMNIAIDRESIVKHLYLGTATVAALWATLPGWDELKPIPYDPERAKQLLAEAGYPNGFSFKLYTHTRDPMLPLLAEATAGYWEAIGLKPEIVRGDYATWRIATRGGKTSGFIWTHLLSSFPDYSSRIPSYVLPDGSVPLWQSQETIVAGKKILAELDPQKREAYWKELARIYHSQYSHVPIVNAARLHGAGKKVGEWSPGRIDDLKNLIFVRHAKPLNTYRLFTP